MKIHLLISLVLFSHGMRLGPSHSGWPWQASFPMGNDFQMGNSIFPMDNHFPVQIFRGLSFI